MPQHKHLPQHDEPAPLTSSAPVAAAPTLSSGPAAPVVGRAFGGVTDALGGSPVVADTAAALRRRRGQGRALPSDVASRFGEQFGADFSGVRVHTDGEASQIARSVQATAFTHGRDIYFSEGTYSPASAAGQHLLAHELTHVVQQQHARPSSPGAPVIGRANDPAEHEAERVAGQVVGALRRSAAIVGPRPTEKPYDIQRLFGIKKAFGEIKNLGKDIAGMAKEGAEAVKDAAVKAKDKIVNTKDAIVKAAADAARNRDATKRIKELVAGEAPSSPQEAATRMVELRTLLTSMTPDGRAKIANDRALMAKAQAYVGPHEFMTLVAAVGMSYKPPAKKGKKGAPAPAPTVKHMSGAEADSFIQENMTKVVHLKRFIAAAVGAGKKAEGFVAVVGQEDWEAVYGQQYDKDEVGTDDELTTNAFIANTHSDRPAIIHHERGTRSTAIHESMHRYSVLNVLNTFGFRLNEGMTEYFTRKITDKDGNPTNGNALRSNRDNYQANFDFVRSLLPMFGRDLVTQESKLAEIYFEGKTDLIKKIFEGRCKSARLTDPEISQRWSEFNAAIKSGSWGDAVAKLPPPPRPPNKPLPVPPRKAPSKPLPPVPTRSGVGS